jgi:hypothetical protein
VDSIGISFLFVIILIILDRINWITWEKIIVHLKENVLTAEPQRAQRLIFLKQTQA